MVSNLLFIVIGIAVFVTWKPLLLAAQEALAPAGDCDRAAEAPASVLLLAWARIAAAALVMVLAAGAARRAWTNRRPFQMVTASAMLIGGTAMTFSTVTTLNLISHWEGIRIGVCG